MRKQFIRFTTFVLICLFIKENLTAQSSMPAINSVVPVSPNAASLAKYGEIPVGFYTGIPNICVPLYEIQSGSLKLPVSVSYHAGGMRVEEVASWVGLGWSLSAGGVISRQVRGIADEITGAGYIYKYDSITAYLGTMNPVRQFNYLASIDDNSVDSQQDIFTYNIGGESGKFVHMPGGGVVSVPLSKNKFEFGNFLGQDSSWKLTDMNGTVYYFTAKESSDAVPVKNGSPSASGYQNISSWYVTKMVSASGKDSINFSYELAATSFRTGISQTKYVYGDVDEAYSNTSVYGKRLTQINFANGNIQFYKKSSAREDYPDDHALDSIVITNTESSYYNKYKFYQSYNTGSGAYGTPTDELKRMFLDSIAIFDAAGRINNYKFTYDQSLTFPARNSFNQDHWGYYNGASNGSYFYPTTNLYYGFGGMRPMIDNDTTYLIQGGANRNPDSSYSQLGILKSVTYPTGGRTEYEYESNKAVNFPKAHDYVTTYDNFLLDTLTTSYSGSFSINENYAGSGGVNASISINNGGGACAEPGGVGCPVVLISGPSGSFYLYQSIGVKFLQKGTYSVSVDLSSVFDPDIIENFVLNVSWGKSAFSDSFFKYNANVGGLRVKKITNYAGTNSKAEIKTYKYLDPEALNRTSGCLIGFPQYISDILYHKKEIIAEGTPGESVRYYDDYYATISSGSNYPMLTTQGSYVGYKNVQELLGENGEFGKNEYTYTDPITFPDLVDSEFPFPPADVFDWKRGQLLRAKNYRYNAETSSYQIVQEKANTYSHSIGSGFVYNGLKVGQNEIYTYPGFDKVYKAVAFTTSGSWSALISDTSRIFDQSDPSKYSQTVTSYEYGLNHYQPINVKTTNSKGDTVRQYMKYPLDYTGLSGSDALTVGIKNLQDKNVVSPVIEKYTQIGNDFKTTQATITSYKPVLPLPDTLFTIELSGTTTSFSPTFVSGGSIVKSVLYQPQVSFNKYDGNGNITEQQKLKDAKHTYLWGYSASYPVAEVTNADSANIAYTSFETGVSGNWTVSSGSPAFVTNSASPTGTKYYTLTGTTLQKTGLNSGTVYIVSYWSSTGSSYSVSGTVSSTKTGATIGGWTYIEHEVTGASSISVSGTGAIDELRLYPKEALMTTYTYLPLAGITSQCDAGNKITYFEYDSMGRLLVVKDEKRKIIKTMSYQF